jgi:hypothetical protein
MSAPATARGESAMLPQAKDAARASTVLLPREVGARAAANEDPEVRTRSDDVPNPLWAITAGMGVFFLIIALVLMTT